MSTPGSMIYDESDHPRMGVLRKSSERNELLIKPKLAAVKRPTRDIPEESFSYGIIYDPGEGIAAALSHHEHVPNPHATKGKDIKAMNKSAPRIYAEDWIHMNEHHKHDHQSNTPHFVPPRSNRATEARSEASTLKSNPAPEKERFVISKFKKVPHKIDNVQTTPLLRDLRPPVFKNKALKKRGPICDAQTAYCGDGDYYPSCGVQGIRTRLPCSGFGMSSLLPRASDSEVCVPAEGAADRRQLLPRFYKACSNPAQAAGSCNTTRTQASDPKASCMTHPRRSDPCDQQALAPVRREAIMQGPRRSDPD